VILDTLKQVADTLKSSSSSTESTISYILLAALIILALVLVDPYLRYSK
jgi:hypothetical protein